VFFDARASAQSSVAPTEVAQAEQRDARDRQARPLSFSEALDLALQRPEAQEAQRVRAARADADGDVHRWVGNPSVQVQLGRRRVPRADAGPEVQATVLQGFTLGRVGAARIEALASELRVLDVEERAERMWAALEAGEAWLALYGAERRQATAEACVVLGQQHLDAVVRARALQRSTDMDVTEATQQLGELRMLVALAQGDVRAAALELAHATAQHGPLPLATAGEPPQVDVPGLEGLRADESVLDGLPTLELQTALAHAAAARAREVERASRGTGALGLYVERDSPRGIVLAGVFQANFGFVDRGGRARSEAAELVARAEAQVVRAHHEAHGLFHAAIDAVELTERSQATHRDVVLGALEERVRQLERGVALGVATRPELLRAAVVLARGRGEQEGLDGAAARARLRLRLLLDAAVHASGDQARHVVAEVQP
jgi:hypothetical protein